MTPRNKLSVNGKSTAPSRPRRHDASNVAGISLARGFSLVELMVAMAIGIIITIAVVQIFGSSRATYRVDQGLSRLQENARYAMDTMTREIRQAGNLGCLPSLQTQPTIDINTNGSTNAALNDFQQGIMGYEYTGTGPGDIYTPPNVASNINTNTNTGWSPALDSSIVPGGKATPGSDVIVVFHVNANPTPLAGQPQPNSASIFLPSTTTSVPPVTYQPPQAGEIAFLTDCQNADLFQVSTVSGGNSTNYTITHSATGSPGNACVSWGTSNGCSNNSPSRYQPNNTVMYTLSETAFFVAEDPNNTADGPGLWEAALPYDSTSGSLTSTEIAHGVDNLQILYGVDLQTAPGQQDDGNANVYLTADQVNAMPAAQGWAKVVSVRFSLLMRTTNITGSATDTTPDTGKYLLNGTDPAFATTIDQSQVHDDLRRRVFTATVSLRNRAP